MLTFKFYDEKNSTQEAWYDSSMFIYTKMVENENNNTGNLYVTFKGGSTYLYKDVKYEDYILLLYEYSNGSALNTHIKPKYKYEKVDSLIVEDLEKRMCDLAEKEAFKKKHTYFISGPLETTQPQFNFYYRSKIQQILDEFPDAYFITSNDNGVDIMAQNLLLDEFNIDPSHLTVYSVDEIAENVNPKVTEFRSGFISEEHMFNEMTRESSSDVTYILDCDVLNNAAKNLLRRKKMKDIGDYFL